MEDAALTKKIRLLLDSNNIKFSEIDHEPTLTCDASAVARSVDIKIGGKSLLLKDKNGFRIFVTSSALNVDLKKARKILGSGKLRLATQQELLDVAGVEKGALPPFGSPILPLDLYMDLSITDNKRIAFNAGVLTKSIIMEVTDYLRIAQPKICQFSK